MGVHLKLVWLHNMFSSMFPIEPYTWVWAACNVQIQSAEFLPYFFNSIFSTYRSTTMAWSPSTCRSASSHQRRFHWATVGPSLLHFGPMCTTASEAMSITGNLVNQKYWRGRRKMLGSTLGTCPTSQLLGPLFQHGTKSPSTEEAKQPRYSCEWAKSIPLCSGC